MKTSSLAPDLNVELLGGRPCLDLANHRARILAAADPYGALLRLGVEVGALSDREARDLAATAARQETRRQTVIARAGALADATREAVVALAAGAAPPAACLEVLNDEIRCAGSHAEILARDGEMTWGWRSHSAELDRPLWPLARDLGELITQVDPCRLKVCDADDCGWLFLDTSKNCRRRWCDMAQCGNRAKARRFRRRQQGNAAPSNP